MSAEDARQALALSARLGAKHGALASRLIQLAHSDDLGRLLAAIHEAKAILEPKGFDPRERRDWRGRWSETPGTKKPATIYYRIQPRSVEPNELLDPRKQISRVWTGPEEGNEAPRRGVSVMRDLNDLVRYMVRRHANLQNVAVVKLEGEPSKDEDFDARSGSELVHPTRILSVEPIKDRQLRDAVYDYYHANTKQEQAEAWRQFISDSGYGKKPAPSGIDAISALELGALTHVGPITVTRLPNGKFRIMGVPAGKPAFALRTEIASSADDAKRIVRELQRGK